MTARTTEGAPTMADEAQTPETPGNGASDPWARTGGGASGEPGQQPSEAAAHGPIPPLGVPLGRYPEVTLDKPGAAPRPAADPWAPPADRTADEAPRESGVPGAGGASPRYEPTVVVPTEAGAGEDAWGGSSGVPGAGGASPHDQPTVVVPTGADEGAAPGQDAWSSPSAPAGAGPGPAPGAFGPPPPVGPGGPFAAEGAPQPYNPFAPPAGQDGVPVVPHYAWPGAPVAPSDGMGTASLVLGIISVVGFCLCGASIVPGVLAVIFGILGLRKARRGEATNGGVALAGIICGAVGMVLAVVVVVAMIFLPDDSEEDSGTTGDSYSTSLVVPRLPRP
ncbi:DUF4190 domain-containing protein [Streptomyces nodosus]|uniref:DUF4190 domain-containing protein n=1 Tax=Streptomyces nodosus TaxID=40318 RepID=UPI00381A3026